jgi:hypothetical protein
LDHHDAFLAEFCRDAFDGDRRRQRYDRMDRLRRRLTKWCWAVVAVGGLVAVWQLLLGSESIAMYFVLGALLAVVIAVRSAVESELRLLRVIAILDNRGVGTAPESLGPNPPPRGDE